METSAPARNFTIPLADHVRAAAGPPAYAVRRRRIEDLEAAVLEAAREALVREGSPSAARAAMSTRADVAASVRELVALVAAHNRYYPIEANLPIDPTSGVLLERGRRWEPLATPDLGAIVERAHREGDDR